MENLTNGAGSLASNLHGLHSEIPESEYHALKAFSQSLAKKVQRSPAHALEYLTHPPKESPALRLGKFAHMAVLERERFDRLEIVKSATRTTKAYKDAVKDHGKDAVIITAELEQIEAIASAVNQHKAARALLNQIKFHELTAIWDWEGLACKARFDGIVKIGEDLAIVDLKTTTDARPFQFQKSLYDFGYHMQGAHYIDGAAACGLNIRWYIIIAVEKESPNAVSVFRLPDQAIQAGRVQMEELKKQWRHCLNTGEYPAYSSEVETLDLPEWVYKKIESGFIA